MTEGFQGLGFRVLSAITILPSTKSGTYGHFLKQESTEHKPRAPPTENPERTSCEENRQLSSPHS